MLIVIIALMVCLNNRRKNKPVPKPESVTFTRNEPNGTSTTVSIPLAIVPRYQGLIESAVASIGTGELPARGIRQPPRVLAAPSAWTRRSSDAQYFSSPSGSRFQDVSSEA